jgi:hypothetical protein
MAAGGRAAPDHIRRHRLGILPVRDGPVARGGKRSLDPVLVGAGHAAVGLEALNGIPEQGVNKRAEDIGIERQRFVGILGRLPPKTVAPDEADRVAQQHLQRRRRQRPFEQFRQPRMRRRDQAVMLRDLVALPVPPARQSRDSDRQLREFRRTGQKPIGLAGGVARRAGAVKIGLRQLRDQRRAAEHAAFGVAPAERNRDAPRRRHDGPEIPFVAVRHRKRIELLDWQHVIRNEPVLRNTPRPAAGIQPQQPDVRAR